jgi:N-acetylmuramic acid 6-phosphate etherase
VFTTSEFALLDRLTTEQRNPASEHVDQMDSLAIVRTINAEDQRIADAVAAEAEPIAQAVDFVVTALREGGRLIYMGAGTSGRLGVLDASECPPTFNTNPEQVVGLIAGGHGALVRSVEGAEDFPEYGARDLEEIQLQAKDVVIGIATSGRTPYVIGGLRYAQSIGCHTVGLACNTDSPLEEVSEVMICPIVGPEIVSGSTRMKAGTATKLVLNSITTAAMIRLGKTFGNLMVDLRATNSKLRDRSRRIVQMLTDVDESTAQQLLDDCDGELKTAIVAHSRNVDASEARKLLEQANQQLRQAIQTGETP